MTIDNLFNKFGGWLESVLPTSPFHQFITQIEDTQALHVLNWFIPVGQILNVLSAWLIAIGLFYLYSIILRWIKAIGD